MFTAVEQFDTTSSSKLINLGKSPLGFNNV